MNWWLKKIYNGLFFSHLHPYGNLLLCASSAPDKTYYSPDSFTQPVQVCSIEKSQ